MRVKGPDLDSTVAALILEEEGRIPEPGAQVTWHDLTLTVDEMLRRRIQKVRVTRNETTPPAEATRPEGEQVGALDT